MQVMDLETYETITMRIPEDKDVSPTKTSSTSRWKTSERSSDVSRGDRRTRGDRHGGSIRS